MDDNYIELKTSYDKEKFVIKGVGKFYSENCVLGKLEAAVLIVELTKFLKQEEE